MINGVVKAMPNSKKNILIYIFTVLLLLAALYLIFGNRLTKKTKFIIGINEWYGYAPIVYADKMGYFKENNIDLELVLFEGQAQSNKAFEKGSINGLLTVLTDVVFLKGTGVPIKVAAVTDFSLYGDAIIAQPKFENLKALKGKIIGIDSLNSFSEFFVTEALKKEGMKPEDVYFKVVPYNKIADALKNNEVQAAHSWDPGKKQAVDSGMKIIFYAGLIPNSVIDTLSFNEELEKEHSDDIKKIVTLFYKARDEMIRNPYQGAVMTSSFFNNDPKSFADSMKEIHMLTEKENRELLKKNQEISQLEQYAKTVNEFFFNKGVLKNNEIYKEIISTEVKL